MIMTMPEAPKKPKRPTGQLNANIGVAKVEAFNAAVQRNGHRHKWVIDRLTEMYVRGEIKL